MWCWGHPVSWGLVTKPSPLVISTIFLLQLSWLKMPKPTEIRAPSHAAVQGKSVEMLVWSSMQEPREWEGSTGLSAWEQSGLQGSLQHGWTWHPGPWKQPLFHGPLHRLEKPFLPGTYFNCVWVHWLLDECRGLNFLPHSPLEARGAPLGSPPEHTQLCMHLKSPVVASCKIHGDISRQSQQWYHANLLSVTESDTSSSLCEVDCSTQKEAKMFLAISRGRFLNSRTAVLSYFILHSQHLEKRRL